MFSLLKPCDFDEYPNDFQQYNSLSTVIIMSDNKIMPFLIHIVPCSGLDSDMLSCQSGDVCVGDILMCSTYPTCLNLTQSCRKYY